MRRVLAIGAVLGALTSAGCSCASAHEIDDAGSPADDGARPATDAAVLPDTIAIDASDAPAIDALDPGAHFFTLEPAVVDLIVTPERCAENEGATAILRVAVHYFSSCDTPGPIDATIDPAAMTITIVPHVWHEHGRADCASLGAEYVRDVAIASLTAGAWTIEGGATTNPYTVDAMPPSTCSGLGTSTAGTVCSLDCECAGNLRCLAVRGDAACERLCADPCETLGVGTDLGLSCASGDACAADPNLGWICEASTVDACDDTHPCPGGMTCPPVSEGPRQCAWAITLDAAIRHACTTESDCDLGLDCVQRVDGTRACEVRCTTSDMACPSATPHACMPGNWVCEWLGE